MKPIHASLLLILALLLPMLSFGLGSHPVSKIQEVRIAETAREMIESGDWGVPRYNGELRLQKPPLPYWVTAASYRLIEPRLVALRMPAVLFGLLTCILLYFWAYREAGLAAAANSALALATSFVGIRYFRSGEADAILLFFIALACALGYAMIFGVADGKRRLLFGTALGLGFLSKGPAALAIPLLTILLAAAAARRTARIRACFSIAGLSMLAATGFGWYAWIYWKLPDAAQHFVSHQLDETFISGTHSKPAWWYLSHLFDHFAPWGALLVPAAWWSYRQRSRAGGLPPLLIFSWAWLGVAFILLTFTVNKQTQYALLLLPPLALIVGHYLAMAGDGFTKINAVLFGVFCLAATIFAAFALYRHFGSYGMAAALFGLALVPAVAKKIFRIGMPSMPVLGVAAAFCWIYLYSESFLNGESARSPVEDLLTHVAEDAPLYQSAPGDGAISFYAKRVVPPVEDAALPAALGDRRHIWFISESKPSAEGIGAEQIATSGDLILFRMGH